MIEDDEDRQTKSDPRWDALRNLNYESEMNIN